MPLRAVAVALLAAATTTGLTLYPPLLGGVANAQPGCQISTHNIDIRHGQLDITANQNRCFATRKARLIFQSDGNLVLYDEVGRARFASNTVGRGHRLILQDDGNLVIYTRRGQAVFSTRTAGHPHDFLAVQTDGNVVIYTRRGRPLFSTHSAH